MDNTAATTAAQSGAGATGQGLAITNARILDGSGGMIESGMAGDVHSGPVNARLLWEAGITYGYGTDTRFLSRDTLAHELKALHLVFSPKDIIPILTRNAATPRAAAKSWAHSSRASWPTS